MGVRQYKPTTPGRRQSSVDDFSDITKRKPEKSLIVIKKRSAGRNSQGRITVHHRGGGSKRYIRLVDFKRNLFDTPAKVKAIEYDPNRGARIALIEYENGKKSYILAPVDLKVDDQVISSKERCEIKAGNRMPLKKIPTGTGIYNIELTPGKGGEIVRSAGLSASLMALDSGYAHLKLPSGEVRMIKDSCLATVGQVSNPDRRSIRWGKAGRMRLKGIRPTVRGKAMNPVDHPHGGGEGSQPIGLKHPKTRTGRPALGVKTRSKKKKSNKYIIKRRNSKK